MNWLATREETRCLLVKNLVKKSFKLGPREVYGLLFSAEGSLEGEEIPYFIIYRFP